MTLPPDRKQIDSPQPVAGPGHLPHLRSWAIGGALLAVVLGGYWYFNGRGDGGGEKRANAAPVRVATVEQRDMAVVERSMGTVVTQIADS